MNIRFPFTANIPIEQEQEMDKKIDIEMMYEKEKDRKIEHKFNNPISNLKKIADYLWLNLNKEISYKQIAEDLNIKEGSVKLNVAELNYFKGFPITMIPVPNKAGFIQSALQNEGDYQKWDSKKMKTITSMGVVKNKAEKITSSKKRVRVKEKIKIKQKAEA